MRTGLATWSSSSKEDPHDDVGIRKSRSLAALRQWEAGTTVVEVCRQLEITEQIFYTWKRKYAGLGLGELRELQQLREENTKLKR